MDCMGCTEPLADFKFSAASPGFSLSPQRHIATFNSSSLGFASITLEPAIETVRFLKLKIHKVRSWVFVGVTTSAGQHPLNHAQASSYGWAPRLKYVAGETSTRQLMSFCSGDLVLVKADLTGKNLSLKRFDSANCINTAHIRLRTCAKEQTKWTFYIELMTPGDQVELLPVSAEDQQLL